jgi:hypothetical protein
MLDQSDSDLYQINTNLQYSKFKFRIFSFWRKGSYGKFLHGKMQICLIVLYWVFRAQADWTLAHTSHTDTEPRTIEASIIRDGVTLTDSLIR